jgi:potassium channel subfamily K
MFVVLHQLRFLLPSPESVSTGAPLIAALLAPAATLFDIPALSQRWYDFDGAQLNDPPASLILSAISLAFSVVANSLLVLRFCVHNPRGWRIAIFVSTMSWFMKTAIGFANLIVFGATRRNGPGYSYDEGECTSLLLTTLASNSYPQDSGVRSCLSF